MAAVSGNLITPTPSPPLSPLSPCPAWLDDIEVDYLDIALETNKKRHAGQVNAQSPETKRARHEGPPTPADDVDAHGSVNEATSPHTSCTTETLDIEAAIDLPTKILSVDELNAMDPRFVPPQRQSPKDADPRQPPPFQPEVYSYFRQALCEALPYYKAYQGSCYTSDQVARGLLLDKQVAIRDYLGSQVIITTCGGGRTLDETSNLMVRTTDQKPDTTTIRAFRLALESKSPIAVIIGEENPLYAWKPSQSYCVMDWFQVTHVWAEKVAVGDSDATINEFKIRLEKVNKEKHSWWAPPAEVDFDQLVWDSVQANFPRCPVLTCETCDRPSPEIYTAGWTCLHYDCQDHFQFEEADMDVTELQYSNTFLAERTDFDMETPPLVPSVPQVADNAHGTEKVFREGIVCPKCGLCSSRIFWNRWFCQKVQHGDLQGCGAFEMTTPMKIYPEQMLQDHVTSFNSFADKRRSSANIDNEHLPTRWNKACIEFKRVFYVDSYKVHQYYLPDQQGHIIGSVTVFPSDAKINARSGGGDELWADLSRTDLGLKRNPVALKGRKRQGLTRHFTHNFGAPYKFGVTVESSGFDEAPPCVLKALHRLDWAADVAVNSTAELLDGVPDTWKTYPPRKRQQYNELLVLGYMTDDKINYHDDGEKNLGPTVATLSLGAPATMKFRPKASAKFPTKMVEEGSKDKHKDVLELPVKHGDMVVMHGAVIHRLYEHAVTPFGDRRFAMTCRYIDPKTMKSPEEIQATHTKGAIPAESYKWAYNGH